MPPTNKTATCTICGANAVPEDVKHLALYVIGSEGVYACLECRQALTDCARHLMHMAGKGRMQGYKAAHGLN